MKTNKKIDIKKTNKRMNKDNLLDRIKDSLKPTKECFKIFGFDILFYAILIPSFALFTYIINSFTENIDTSLLSEQIIYESPEMIQALNSSLQSLLIAFISGGIIFFILAVLGWSISRGLCYSKLLKKKFNKEYLIKLFFMNLFYAVFIGLIIILPFLALISSINAILQGGRILAYIVLIISNVVLFLIAYMISTSYIIMTKKDTKIFESIGKAITKCAKNLKNIYKEGIIIIVATMIITAVLLRVQNYIVFNTTQNAGAIITMIVTIIFLATTSTWARNLFVKKMEEMV